MEDESGFLEDVLTLRRETWETTYPPEVNDIFSNGWTNYNENPSLDLLNSSLEGFEISTQLDFSSSLNEFNSHFGNNSFVIPNINSLYQDQYSPLFTSIQEQIPPTMDNEISILLGHQDHPQNLEENQTNFKVEPIQPTEIQVSEMGLCLEKKQRSKKVDGQPSKNLMAERRRRKRLNDRLSMLRSIVPKISKMDRTSILGDTIDYMKELLERIKILRGEFEVEGYSNQLNLMNIMEDIKQKEVLVRNTPKFDVERRISDTRIEICCSGKPSLLFSTINTIEALGFEIEQCVISCFNDFSMQASCSEELEQRQLMSTEEIKQTLFRGAGYGGRII